MPNPNPNPNPNPATIPSFHILRLPSPSLSSYPRLNDLITLLNTAFVTSWHEIPGLVGRDAKRYKCAADFVEDMGAEGATWVAFDGEERMVATAGYKPWGRVWNENERIRGKREEEEEEEEVIHQAQPERKADAEAEMDKFEVVAVAVDPSRQKSGLASRLCGELELELKEKARMAGNKRVSLMVRSGTNEEYWARKGYRTVGEMTFPIGAMGSKTGFSIFDMERMVEV